MKEIINKIFEMAKSREIHPSGDLDKAGRWYPDDLLSALMDSVRSPTRSYPWSYMSHCRTKKFIKKCVEKYQFTSLEEALAFYRTGKEPAAH